MALTTRQRKFLRAEAHHLKPVVLLGQHGLTESVLNEIDQALTVHELIKVRVPGQERENKAAIIEKIATHCRAEPVQTIGHVAIFYRRRKNNPTIALPR